MLYISKESDRLLSCPSFFFCDNFQIWNPTVLTLLEMCISKSLFAKPIIFSFFIGNFFHWKLLPVFSLLLAQIHK